MYIQFPWNTDSNIRHYIQVPTSSTRSFEDSRSTAHEALDSTSVADLIAAFVTWDRKKTFNDSGSLHVSLLLGSVEWWVRGRRVFVAPCGLVLLSHTATVFAA